MINWKRGVLRVWKLLSLVWFCSFAMAAFGASNPDDLILALGLGIILPGLMYIPCRLLIWILNGFAEERLRNNT
ncbi:hypothetical protein [Candidatus Berkiella aquae]|uniref:DUF2892 domain-containing protein n=1 Tax=Candidatus Berkiella aquae TaxID=295108 RepID=A0AAE3L884_9GAMM|nr:hypothetical protein [Candidatus Berkiella aquae]MCS5710670.1 hypothetical protein [Candidatus Berkiella aquae]